MESFISNLDTNNNNLNFICIAIVFKSLSISATKGVKNNYNYAIRLKPTVLGDNIEFKTLNRSNN